MVGIGRLSTQLLLCWFPFCRRDPKPLPGTLVPFKYDSLPLGDIKPLGWLRDQLSSSASGLPGHEWDFYRFVNNSTWTGGSWEYSGLHETAPYWFNYIVPLAYSLDDARLKAQAREFLEHVLETQHEDGWLGPEKTKRTRGLYTRFLLLAGMIQYVEAEPAEMNRVLSAVHRFVDLANEMLKDGFLGLIPVDGDEPFAAGNHGVTRIHELATTFQWLYDHYPNGNEKNIWGAIDLMFKGAIKADRDWRTFFVDGVFPTRPWPHFNDRRFTHGVDLAEGLRWTTAFYRISKDEALVAQAHEGVRLTFEHHGANSGTITADEQLAGLSPNRGSELCMAVETMFSMSYLYRFYGTNAYADRVERVAFNALPAMVTPDWWGHQYVALANQPWAFNTRSTIFANVNGYGTVFGLEPNYPCCTVNHPQGYPKFLASSFVKKGRNGLIHALLSPATVKTILGDGNEVSVTANTNYPFNPTIKYVVTASASFNFFIRIPGWAVLKDSSISTSGSQSLPLTPDSSSLQKVAIFPGQTFITITFGQKVDVVNRENDAVAIHRGPLLYALDLDYTIESFPSLGYWSKSTLPESQLYPPYTEDHFLYPKSAWNIAIDPRTIVANDSASNTDTPLPNPVFAKGAPPLWIEVDACEVEWGVENDLLAPPPRRPKCMGAVGRVRFSPYGSTKVRMTELPVMAGKGLEGGGEL